MHDYRNRRIAMKLLCCLLAAGAALAVASCAKTPASSAPEQPSAPAPSSEPEDVPPPPEPEVCGGTTDSTNPNAPKTIESDEITSFSGLIALKSYDLREFRGLTQYEYELTAKKDGDTVACTRNGEEFTADPAFLEDLQAFVKKYDLAQYNGIWRETHGLPEFFGTELNVEYVSGERIAASDNSDQFLPMEAVTELVALFGADPHYTSITQEEAKRMMDAGDCTILDVRTWEEYETGHIPGAICLPNEDIQKGEAEYMFRPEETILVYCRSGRRSKEAAQALAELGLTRVYEFGGIIDWPYEVVTEDGDE